MNLVKASIVARDLRKIADCLDQLGDQEIKRIAADNYHWSREDKPYFLKMASIMPRPFEKHWSDSNLRLAHEFEGVRFATHIERELVCELIEPAKPAVYRCDPVLEQDEVNAIDGTVA